MANSYTTQLKKRLPAIGDVSWDDEWHDNENIDDVVVGAILSGNRIIYGGDVTAGSGLVVNFAAASGNQGSPFLISSGSLTMTASKANWVYIDNSGAVVTGLTPPSGSYIPLALVDTSASGISRIADLRPLAETRPEENLIINGNFDFWQYSGPQYPDSSLSCTQP